MVSGVYVPTVLCKFLQVITTQPFIQISRTGHVYKSMTTQAGTKSILYYILDKLQGLFLLKGQTHSSKFGEGGGRGAKVPPAPPPFPEINPGLYLSIAAIYPAQSCTIPSVHIHYYT